MVIRRDSLPQQVAEALRSRIADGEWQVGEKLMGEAKLAAEFEVGRSTIREAIRSLQAVGVLESRQGLGVFIRAPATPSNWEEILKTAAITDVIDARIALETDAARLAAERRTPVDLARLHDALEHRLEIDPHDISAHVRADHQFHHAVLLAAHSPVLNELFTACLPRSEEGMVSLLKVLKDDRPPIGTDHAVHGALYRAISDGDATLAAEVSRTHLTDLRSLWLNHIELPTP